MFAWYSNRARRIVFLSRKIAGQRGAAEIGVEDLIEALVVEDQGEFATSLFGGDKRWRSLQDLPEHRSYFTAETAAKIRRGLKPLLQPKDRPLPDSMVHLSAASKAMGMLSAAHALRNEFRHKSETPTRMGFYEVEPLHLLATALADETSEVAQVVKAAGVEREAVIAAIRTRTTF